MTLRAAIACLPLLLAACVADVRVQPADPADTLRDRFTTRLTSSTLSRGTRDALDLVDLAGLADAAPLEAADRLRDLAEAEPDASWRLAAAEILLDVAEDTRPTDASLYLACAREADLELQRAIARGGGLLDARTEFAADLYHRAVSRFISHSDQSWLGGRAAEAVDGRGGSFAVVLEGGDRRRWPADRFDQLMPADLMRIEGMRNHHRLDAYGAPVVAIREQERADPPRAEPFIPPEGDFAAATATARFDGSGAVVIELWNPDHVTAIERHGASLRLSTDTTAPIASLFARAELVRVGLDGMTEVRDFDKRIGIYLHEPYDPSKIPVLLVHGLRSSPATWRNLLNDLRADPVIRRRYQFWMFLYPTGLPVPRSATYLRHALDDVRQRFDPDRTSSAMDRMVVIGHSMGGLLTKAQVQASGDALWHSLHPEPFDDVTIPPDVRAHLQEVFFYDADDRIARIVFIATPHRGSEMASSWIGRFGDALVDLPEYLDATDDWLDDERERLPADDRYQLGRGVPSSIDDLREDAPHLRAYLAMPMRDDVPYHSIAGDRGDGSDGIVAVDSALLGGGASQLIVEAAHDAHTHPLAIREVRRVLLLHLDGE